MNLRKLVFLLILFFSLVFSLSMIVQAAESTETEYEEVQASEILKQIENGEDVYYKNCRVIGKLDLNKIELETVTNPKYREFSKFYGFNENDLEFFGVNRELKVVDWNITIHNSIFEDDLDFSNTLFRKPLSLDDSCFSEEANFISTQFNYEVTLKDVTFNDEAKFWGANFVNSVDFTGSTFGDNVDFQDVVFGDFTCFSDVTFGDSAYFGNATFGNFVYFIKASFGDLSNFKGATFGNYTSFLVATFGDSIIFERTTFGNNASFFGATFGDSILFERATFGDFADFSHSIFEGSSHFSYTTFGDSCSFELATFDDSAYFRDATFGCSTEFGRINFADSVDFSDTEFRSVSLAGTDFNEMKVGWDSLENSLVFDGLTYVKLIRNFRNLEQFEDADAAYYQYRKYCQAEKPWISFQAEWSWISFPKLGDIFMWLTCGYGVKPFRAFGLGGGIIFLFSLLYWRGNGISQLKESSGGSNQKTSFSDAFYFSMVTFATIGYGDWYPKDKFKKWVMIEGFLGWLTLGLFLVTLTNVMIRP